MTDQATHVHGILFKSGQDDVAIDLLDQLHALDPNDDQLLWLDLQSPTEECLAAALRDMRLPAAIAADWRKEAQLPYLRNCGESFWINAIVVEAGGHCEFSGSALCIAVAPNRVLTLHAAPLGFIEQLRSRELGQTELGRLNAASFAASLLDWQLSSYLEAVAKFELAIEKIEIAILSQQQRNPLDELRQLRHSASRLRRLLAPHRAVFSALSRPDFRPQEEDAVNNHFTALDLRFERTMDQVDNAREMVVGSFELFSSGTALVINDSMRVLTWVTVIIGAISLLLAFVD